MIVRALYGGKSTRADYWRNVRSAMEEIGILSCKTDPDAWFQPALNYDGVEHHQCVLLYVDDFLAVVEEPEIFHREELRKTFTLKEKSIRSPEQHLGTKFHSLRLKMVLNVRALVNLNMFDMTLKM